MITTKGCGHGVLELHTLSLPPAKVTAHFLRGGLGKSQSALYVRQIEIVSTSTGVPRHLA